MSVTVRPATVNDAEAACEVLRRSIRELCVADHQNNEVTLNAWLENKTTKNIAAWVTSPQSYSVVALRDSDISGFAMVSRDGSLRLCYLIPEIQYLGAGKAMLSALEAEAARWGLKSLHLESTKSAKTFYERNGYASTENPIGSAGAQTAYPMRKNLAL